MLNQQNDLQNDLTDDTILSDTATLSGFKWHDFNQNGQWDPTEPGLENWVIFLDENQNGILDTTEQSTLTNADGQYTFTNLTPGTYTIAEVVQPGWQQVYPVIGTTLFQADFSTDNGSPSLDGFTIDNSIDNTGATVEGLWHLSTGRGNQPGHSLGDSLYFGQDETSDGGGNYDVGHTAGRVTSPVIDLSTVETAQLSFNYILETEAAAPSWDNARVLVSADGNPFELIASNALELSDPATDWTNVIIDLGEYVGSEIQLQFDFDTGDSLFNSHEGWYIDDVEIYSPNAVSHSVTVGADDVVTDLNFGNVELPTGSISGYKWHDLNQNGIQDSDEPGLAGWTIYLDDNQNGQLDADEQSTVTDANGEYSFSDLISGTYTVAEVAQPGWQQTYPQETIQKFQADFTADDGSASLDGFTIDNTGATVEGLWHLSTGRGNQVGHSAIDSLYFGQGEGPDGNGNYDVGNTAGRITSPLIDLNGLEDAELSFNYILETEASIDWDNAQVLIAVDGNPFIPIASNDSELLDPTLDWSNASIDLSAYIGNTVQIQFDFVTGDDILNDFEGWYVDDVQVVGISNGSQTVPVGIGEIVSDINFGNVLLNQPPVAENDSFSVDANGGLTNNVLLNDSDINSDPLTISEVNGEPITPGTAIALPSGALLTINSDGSFSYDPNSQFDNLSSDETVIDSFTYVVVDDEGASSTATVNITINGIADSILLIGTPGDDELIGDSGDDLLAGNDGDDSIDGGSGDDQLLGNHGQDTLLGQFGNDLLIGNQGNDSLLGGAGDDQLNGGLGDDVIDGGSGNDQILSGPGADTIVLRPEAGLDQVFDFEDGADTFLVEELSVGQIQLVDTNIGVMIQSIDTGALIAHVVGTSSVELTEADFAFA